MARQSKTSHKIAFYIRVSTEEQARNPEGSLKSQEQRLNQHIEYLNQTRHFGELVHTYVDKAKSGKNTKRPQLQKLFKAIENGEVTMLMVTDISRLSRSMKDFCGIWDFLKEHGCKFQSLREQFDTTTAAGEMILLSLVNMAQFERRQVSERVSANFLARAQRGLFNGGSVPFGYLIDEENRGHLRIREDEAEVVRAAFAEFLDEGSLSLAVKNLNAKGYSMRKSRQGGGDRKRLGYFTVENLHQLLTRKAYAGLRVFNENGKERAVKAAWPAIIEKSIFAAVQTKLKGNYRRFKNAKNNVYPYLVSGLVRCATCGANLPGKSAHGNGGKIPYYEHTKNLNCKSFTRFPGKKLEPKVWETVENLLNSEKMAKNLIERAKKKHQGNFDEKAVTKIKREIRSTEEQIEAVAEHLVSIPKGVSPAPIYKQMQRLEEKLGKAQDVLVELEKEVENKEMPVQLEDYCGFLREVRGLRKVDGSERTKQKIIDRLVYRIEAMDRGLRLHFYVGEDRFKVPEDKKGARRDTPGSCLKFFGSKSLQIGQPDWI